MQNDWGYAAYAELLEKRSNAEEYNFIFSKIFNTCTANLGILAFPKLVAKI
jgi:hypothetical protein